MNRRSTQIRRFCKRVAKEQAIEKIGTEALPRVIDHEVEYGPGTAKRINALAEELMERAARGDGEAIKGLIHHLDDEGLIRFISIIPQAGQTQ